MDNTCYFKNYLLFFLSKHFLSAYIGKNQGGLEETKPPQKCKVQVLAPIVLKIVK
jgi:hypothetical protein